MVLNTESRQRNKLKSYKRLIYASVVIFMGFAFWQGYAALQVHSRYQQSLMESVINRISNEYQLLINSNQIMLNEFQQNHKEQLLNLYADAENVTKSDYMRVLESFRQRNADIRLFSLIDPSKKGILSHITGDFLPDCKEEIESTFTHSHQEELFLHRSSQSIHYDLLMPLHDTPGAFLFVAFNVDKIGALLTKYRLPHQELFLLRNDKKGKIELSSTSNIEDNLQSLVMTNDEINSFSFIQPIPNTRWNLAIRLSQTYRTEIIHQSLIQAVMLTLFFCLILFFLYRMLSRSTSQLIQVRDFIYQRDKYDPLTGALNQYQFVSTLSEQLKQDSKTTSYLISFRFIDEKGQRAKSQHYSDYYMKHFSSALMTFVGDGCHFGRVKDIVFATSPKITARRATYIAESALKYVADYNTKYQDNVKVQVVALALDGKFHSGFQLVKAMSGIHLNGLDANYTVLNSNSPEVAQVIEDQHMLTILKQAIDNEDILLYRQSISNLQAPSDGQNFEVLVRLEHDGNILPPIKFIPLAEQTGLIVELDKLIIKKSLAQLSRSPNNQSISVNLSGKTITDPQLKGFIQNAFKQNQVDAHRVTFEITETYAVANIEVALDFIQWARELGCQFALDDFGQGVSSFSYLQALPISKLKIDGCFIRNINDDQKSKLLVKTMVTLCQQLGLESVAEFVENKEIQHTVQSLGVNYGQGYGIHKPELWT